MRGGRVVDVVDDGGVVVVGSSVVGGVLGGVGSVVGGSQVVTGELGSSVPGTPGPVGGESASDGAARATGAAAAPVEPGAAESTALAPSVAPDVGAKVEGAPASASLTWA